MVAALGRLRLKHMRLTVGLADRNLARLLGFRDLADEIDMQEAVHQRGAGDLDVVGELEAALESARRDALIEHLAWLLVGRRLLVAADRQGVFLRLDRELVIREARDRDRNAVGVIAGALDVVGRVAGRSIKAGGIVEHRKQAIEADGRTIKGSKIESSHGISSMSDMRKVRPEGPDRERAAWIGRRTRQFGRVPGFSRGLGKLPWRRESPAITG